MTSVAVVPVDTLEVQGWIIDIARIAPRESAGAHCEGIGQRYVDCTAEAVTQATAIVDTAGPGLHAAAEAVERGIDCDILQQTANATGPIQRTLRSAQHFDAREIA